MKKVILALGVIFIALYPASEAYAGSLNTYENEVISAAKQIYEYNGVKYKVEDSFINQLVDYLSTDGVDLTAEQRDEVMQTAFASIPDGIAGGYLVPVPGQELPTNINTGSNNQTTPSSGNNQGEGSSENGNTTPIVGNDSDNEKSSDTVDTTSGKTSESNNSDNSTSENTTSDTSKDLGLEQDDTKAVTKESSTEKAVNASQSKDEKTSTKSQVSTNSAETVGISEERIISEILKALGSYDIPQGSSTNQKSNDAAASTENKETTTGQINNEIKSSDTEVEVTSSDLMDYNTEENIIKQTGFDFSDTVIILAGMVLLMFAGVCVVMKSELFAHKHGK